MIGGFFWGGDLVVLLGLNVKCGIIYRYVI